MPKYFQYISYSRWVFYLWGMYLVFSEAIYQNENSLSKIGFGIYLMGISLAVGSLSNSEKFSKKDKKVFDSPRKMRMLSRWFLSGIIVFFVMGAFFISIQYINPTLAEIRANNYSNLGFGCFALALGMIFELKQLYNKKMIFQQIKKQKKDDNNDTNTDL
jgi:hypothetical protein